MLGKRKGLCHNSDFCSKAKVGEIIKIHHNDEFHCPECYHPLSPFKRFNLHFFAELFILVMILFLSSFLAWWLVRPIVEFRKGKGELKPVVINSNLSTQKINLGDLEKTFFGKLISGKTEERTVILSLKGLHASGEKIIGRYTLNLNSVQARRDSIFVIKPDKEILYSEEFGELQYERRANSNRIILYSFKAGADPYWYFEEAGN